MAIDTVSALPPGPDGFRGAIVLKPGTYQVAGTLFIAATGVVVRGEGAVTIEHSGANNANPEKESLFLISPDRRFGRAKRHGMRLSETRTAIIDRRLSLGARTFRLASVANFKVGQNVHVVRTSTAKWIRAIGMDRIPTRPDGRPIRQWQAGKFDISYLRRITAIEGDRVTVDAPLFHTIDAELGPGFIELADLSRIIRNVGLENITAISMSDGAPQDANGPEDHPWHMISFDGVIDGFVRGITARGYPHAAVRTAAMTKNISVFQSRYLAPVSKITGRRRYAFHLQGQLHLGWRLYAEYGRHDFATARQWSSGVVFLESTAERVYAPSEPHHRYSTGILYDNVTIRAPAIGSDRLVLALWNRGNYGSGHGWAAANSVLWNCIAEGGVAVEKPPLAQNYAIGVRSSWMSGRANQRQRVESTSFNPADAHWEHWNSGLVTPRSLYRSQLRDRLGAQAIANMEGSLR